MLNLLVKEKKSLKNEKLGKEYIKSFLCSAIEDAFCCGEDETVEKYIGLYDSVDLWFPDVRSEDERKNFIEQVKRVTGGLK